MSEIYVMNLDQISGKQVESGKKAKIASVMQVIRFSLDNFEFALDIMDVKEIKEMDIIRHLPNSLPFVKGLLNLRGEIIPVLDLKKKLELENLSLEDLAKMGEKQGIGKFKEKNNEIEESKEDAKKEDEFKNKQYKVEEEEKQPSIIICKVGSENFGIIVDKIYRVQYLSVDEYEKTPDLFENIGKNFIKGFAKLQNKVIVILSLANLFY